MRCLIDNHTFDPYWNLAAEEYLLDRGEVPFARLWRDRASVIVGRYQNAAAEVNGEYVREHGIPVVRRLTGGGAVFHDPGNINFTFVEEASRGEDTAAMFRRFTAPVISALRAIGVDAVLSGRNDLLVEGRKISGCAVCVRSGRVLQHGTLLFRSSVGELAAALNTRPEKFSDKAVKSNAARVTNMADHLPKAYSNMGVEEMMAYLGGCIARGEELPGGYSAEQVAGIDELCRRKYSTREWNFGMSPGYGWHNAGRISCGFVEVYLQVEGDVVRGCSVMGDYFFTRPTEEFCAAMVGVRHSYAEVLGVLKGLPVADYFGKDVTEELAELLCFG